MRGNTNAKCVYVHGKPQDISFELLETAGGIYGIEVDSDAENIYQNFKITNAIIDEPEQRGIYIHTASIPAIIKGAFIYPVNTIFFPLLLFFKLVINSLSFEVP